MAAKLWNEMTRLVSGTPKSLHPDNVEDEVNEGAAEQSSPSSRSVANGEKVTLGNDLPDIPDDSWPTASSPLSARGEPPSNMGANQSSEEVNTALHSTSTALRPRNGGNEELQKPSTGRLKPTKRTTSNQQRILSTRNAPRGSVYDLEPHSPNKPLSSAARLAARSAQLQPQFSPIRKEKKRAAEAEKQQEATTEQESRQVGRRSQRRALQDDGPSASPGAEDGANDGLFVSEAETGPPKQQKRGRGRPKRNPTQIVENGDAQAQPGGQMASDAVGADPHSTLQSRRKATKPAAIVQIETDANTRGSTNVGAEGEERGDSDFEVPVTEEESEPSQESQHEPLLVDKVRPSELFFPENSRPTSSEEQLASTGNRKRKQPHAETDQANTARKRTKRVRDRPSLESAAVREDADEDIETVPNQLLGQWKYLQHIVKSLKYVGCNVIEGRRQKQKKIKLQDEEVIAVVELCAEAKKRFTGLYENTITAEPDVDPASVLQEIGERVDGLRGFNDEYPANFKDETRCINIYFHLIPALVKLVKHAARCYLLMDDKYAPRGQIKIGHLRIIRSMIKMILDLESAAAKKYERPDPALCVVQPIHNGVAVPLRAVDRIFVDHILDHERREKRRQWEEDYARARALRLEQEQRRERQEARIKRRREKWHDLHAERQRAEGGFIPVWKAKHLQVPSMTAYESDRDGLLFSRQEVFIPRVGPPPRLIDEASRQEWHDEELIALHDGLRQYTGPLVFEKICRRYCGRGQILNRFNVTQIVTTAAMLKERLIEAQMKDEEFGGVVEQWVRDIPMWTKMHATEGQENDDSVVEA